MLEILPKNTYGTVRVSKDVIFDMHNNFKHDSDAHFPTDEAFALIPSLYYTDNNNDPIVVPERVDLPGLPSPAPLIDPDYITPVAETEHSVNDDMIYWSTYTSSSTCFPVHLFQVLHYNIAVQIKDPYIPIDFWTAMQYPEWEQAINTERTKFEVNNCFRSVPFTGQHLVPMMWLFSIKTDGTKKARLVGRGDLMIPWVDFDPYAVYCGNVNASSIKIALVIAATYKLSMRGGDLVGAYLITLANPDFPVHIKTPQGYTTPFGTCFQAIGNLYGFPPAGQNFSKEFDKCVRECGYENTPWDLKFFFKWVQGQPLILIAHSDDFRWFGPLALISEWDLLIATFNSHKYEVTDATSKEFVGIRITCDEHFNYYMDQSRMITSIVSEANLAGAADEHLPYPPSGESLSKADNSTDLDRHMYNKYPYRRVVGQLMYGMVHTLITIMYALNILSRYSNSPGARHIKFLKHLLRYVKYAKMDRLKFTTHDGPTDIATMTSLLQLKFQCDADLAGNKDNRHSQTSYIGYLADNVICWKSTDQGSISSSTAESEIKAVNHALKSDVIPLRGILNHMGWTQAPTVIEEDNSACVDASNHTHMTKNLRHIDLSENYFKDKVADGTCVIVKIPPGENNSDIGTKRVPLPLFEYLTHRLVDKSLRNNIK